MFRVASLICLAAAAVAAKAQDEAAKPLAGTLDGDVYTSPTGAFSIEVPVLPALGG